jgi:esterase
MVTVGCYEDGRVMIETPNGFEITRTAADVAGAPTVLLIHGFLDDASVWDCLVDIPCGRGRDSALRPPGFGTRTGSVAEATSATLESWPRRPVASFREPTGR